MDTRFIYINSNVAVRVCEIKAVYRPSGTNGNLADYLCVFTGNGENDYYTLQSDDFNKTFGTDYSKEHLQKHLVELFLNELNEGVVNRPNNYAEVTNYMREPDNSVVIECPVCGWKEKFVNQKTQKCYRCGVMLDMSKVRPAMKR